MGVSGPFLAQDLAPSPDTRNRPHQVYRSCARLDGNNERQRWLEALSGFAARAHRPAARIPRGIGTLTSTMAKVAEAAIVFPSAQDDKRRWPDPPYHPQRELRFLLHVLEHIPDVRPRARREARSCSFCPTRPDGAPPRDGARAFYSRAAQPYTREGQRARASTRACHHGAWNGGRLIRRTKDDWAALIRPGKHPLGYPDDWMDTHPLTPYDIEVMAQQREQDADRDERKTGAQSDAGPSACVDVVHAQEDARARAAGSCYLLRHAVPRAHAVRHGEAH